MSRGPDRQPRRRWTLPQLRRLAARRIEGARVIDLAAEVGCSAQALRAAWARSGIDTVPPTRSTRRAARVEHADLVLEGAYWMHFAGRMPWPAVAEVLGWEGTVSSLKLAVRRFAEATPRIAARR